MLIREKCIDVLFKSEIGAFSNAVDLAVAPTGHENIALKVVLLCYSQLFVFLYSV